MVRILVVEPNEVWQRLLKRELEDIAVSKGDVDVQSNYDSVDSLLGLTQNGASGARYGYYVINANLPRSPRGIVEPFLGIELALKIAEVKKQPKGSVYITSSNPVVLEGAKKSGFFNTYLRNPQQTARYPNELQLYYDLQAQCSPQRRESALARQPHL